LFIEFSQVFEKDACMHPNGINHLAIATRDIKGQIAFFTQILGGELKALYWMHGVENTFHGFVELSSTCYLAFQQHPDNPSTAHIGVTHAGNAGGQVTAGTMQHLAFNVDTLDDLYEMRDRIRSSAIPVMGPINHGMCQSIYFAGPEGLALEVTHGRDIDERAWIDPEVQALAGISNEEIAQYVSPPTFIRPAEPIAQPAYDPSKPHLVYPEPAYQMMLTIPDDAMWNAVTSEPPVKVAP
jgi:catechol 2,3-dioxygenase-like lactoylglutathione lyase family enzyme